MSEAKRNASNVANLWEIYSQKVFQRKSKPYRQPWKGNISVCPQVLDKIRTVGNQSIPDAICSFEEEARGSLGQGGSL